MTYQVSTSVLFSIVLVLYASSLVGAQNSNHFSNCTSRPDLSCYNLNFTIGECNETTGICDCQQATLDNCFTLNESNNYCVESKCYSYLPDESTCRFGRKRKLVALLLSIFLINFGAANFYVEKYEYAIPQIILGLALCLFQFGSCAVAGTRHGDTTLPCIVCCSINTVLSLLFLSWWVADLIIFATNQRMDGSSCPLY